MSYAFALSLGTVPKDSAKEYDIPEAFFSEVYGLNPHRVCARAVTSYRYCTSVACMQALHNATAILAPVQDRIGGFFASTMHAKFCE